MTKLHFPVYLEHETLLSLPFRVGGWDASPSSLLFFSSFFHFSLRIRDLRWFDDNPAQKRISQKEWEGRKRKVDIGKDGDLQRAPCLRHHFGSVRRIDCSLFDRHSAQNQKKKVPRKMLRFGMALTRNYTRENVSKLDFVCHNCLLPCLFNTSVRSSVSIGWELYTHLTRLHIFVTFWRKIVRISKS